MELHMQQCQRCGNRTMRNIVVRQPGEYDKVYAQCTACEAFVASYLISPLGYYHDGKGYESFLRSIQRSGEFMSGRNMRQVYNNRVEKEQSQFQRVVQKLAERENAPEKDD